MGFCGEKNVETNSTESVEKYRSGEEQESRWIKPAADSYLDE